MDECNGSIPEERQGKIHSVTCWLQATAVSGWGWGTYLLHSVQSLQRRILVFLYRYWLLLFGGLTLLLAIRIQYALPQWYVSGVQFLQANLLIVGTLVLLLLFLFVWKVPKWQVANISDEKDRLATESGFRQTLVQIVGGAALLGGLYFTAQTLRTSQETLRVNQKTLETTQQGQITERFTKAIEQLGDKERLMIRLGEIYALERIARDSELDHGPVMEVLTAFVREQVPAKTRLSDSASGEGKTKETPQESKLPPDIQAILTVLGRRTRTFGKGEKQHLDLSNTNLQGANLIEAQLQNVILGGAQLQNANLSGAQLQNANLSGAQLQGKGTKLVNAQLQNAILAEAWLQDTYLLAARLQDADLTGARLQGAHLSGGQLQSAHLRGAQLQDADLTGAQLQDADLQLLYVGRQLQDPSYDPFGSFEKFGFTEETLREYHRFMGSLDTAFRSVLPRVVPDFPWVQFERYGLKEGLFQRTDLTGARLWRADLTRARLQGANLTEVKGLTQDQINTACVDEITVLPKGLTKPAPCSTKP